MKILLLLTLYLISGSLSHSKIVGYSGGNILINTNIIETSIKARYISKFNKADLFDVLHSNSRFSLSVNDYGFIIVFIRHLMPQDDGIYRIGNEMTIEQVTLRVQNDSCCGTSNAINAYIGENVNITCNYPDKLQKSEKHIMKLYADVKDTFSADAINIKNSRFSISAEMHSNVQSLNIRNVRKADEGVYLCGAWFESNHYYLFINEIELQVKEKQPKKMDTTTQPMGNSYETPLAASTEIPALAVGSNLLIISVSVFVALLLITGFVLMIYKLRRQRKQGSEQLSSGANDTPQVDLSYQNDVGNISPYGYYNTNSTPDQQSRNNGSTIVENHVQDHNTVQPNLVYQNINHQTNQSDSINRGLNVFTNQSGLFYQTLDLNLTPSDSVYQGLVLDNQSDSVYMRLDPCTINQDPVDQSVNTNRSDSFNQHLKSMQSNSVKPNQGPTINQTE